MINYLQAFTICYLYVQIVGGSNEINLTITGSLNYFMVHINLIYFPIYQKFKKIIVNCIF